jgi:hypothetical protein
MAESIELRRARQRRYVKRKRLADRLTRKVGSRVIVCPSGYVVLMVPADRVAQLGASAS